MAANDNPQENTDIFMPDKPIMGGLVQSRRDEYVVWTGGKPKYDWSKLDDSAKTEPLRSLQLRTLTDKRYIDREAD